MSHETIYQALYVQGRGELRQERAGALRTGLGRRAGPNRPHLTRRSGAGEAAANESASVPRRLGTGRCPGTGKVIWCAMRRCCSVWGVRDLRLGPVAAGW